MLNDKYFPKDVYGGSNAYLGQTNVSIVPNGGLVTTAQGEYDGFKYPHLQLRNVSFDARRKGNQYDRILDGITLETRGGDLLAIMATRRKNFYWPFICGFRTNFYALLPSILLYF